MSDNNYDLKNVDHPKHYNCNAYECIDEMVLLFGLDATIAFCRCNAWKYRERAPYKGRFKEDNDKADWYIERAEKLLEEKRKLENGC